MHSTREVGSEASEEREGGRRGEEAVGQLGRRTGRNNGFCKPIRVREIKGGTQSTQEAPGGRDERSSGRHCRAEVSRGAKESAKHEKRWGQKRPKTDREGAQRKKGSVRPIRFRAVKARTESTQEAPGGGEEAAAGNAMQS